jgi:nucleoside-triphosphatase
MLSLIPTKPDEIFVIDEIGKMECLSPLFRQTLITVLDTKHQVIGSIAQKGDRFIQKIKERNDIMLIDVSEKNRDNLADSLITTMSS